MSRAITVTLLSGLMLTACCVSTSGCRSRSAVADHTWRDANGNAIPERWKTDANGNRLLDAEGRPVPDPHVPFDSYHRPWVFTNGAWAPLPPPAGSSSSHSSSRSSGLWLWGGSGYRSTGGSSYHPAGSSSSSAPSSSISRGGFGSTAAGASGG